MSCLLFHGPGARQTALDEAHRIGCLMAEPIGDAGLTVQEAREFVSLMLSPCPTGEIGVLMVGPMDHGTTQKSSDVLLKTIEEFDKSMQPILWAHDLGAVIGTIRSRCLDRWCPQVGDPEVDDELDEAAQDLVRAILSLNFWRVPRLVAQFKKREVDLLRGVVEVLAGRPNDKEALQLWDRLRSATFWTNPTQVELIAAFTSTESA